jgi:serine/threonine protein kinase/tetratricopeptide (TPR) repeat protein
LIRPGYVIADRFELESVAGSGGMGTVYRAKDRQTSGPVAVKVITNERDASRFVREAEALHELSHPGIVQYVAHGVADGIAYLAMEWLEGEDLQNRLEREPLTISESLTIALRASSALASAHGRGVVHRDIKPSNLFLVAGNPSHVKVLDFGVARMGARSLTHTGVMVGTPGYASPEQARGLRTIDARTDVFALGCVLFECLTGRPAFVGEHPIALLAKILLEDTPRAGELCNVPGAIDELLARAMSKDPAIRPADGAALGRELEALCASPDVFLAGRPSTREDSVKSSLTVSEQRVVSVIVVRGERNPPTDDDPLAVTVVDTRPATHLQAIEKTAEVHGARVDTLLDGSLVLTLSGSAAATDTATRSARCALAIRAALPNARIGLSTGRAEATSRIPIGDVLTSAVRLAVVAEGVPIDDVTAGLLDARFHVRSEGQGFQLLAERELVSRARTLLGRPTPCMGREREIGTLAAIFDGTVADGVASCVLVTGPAGIGKSRVREELVQRLAGRDFALWIASGDSIRRGTPFGMIAHPLRQEIRDGEAPDSRRRKLGARVARNVKPSEQLRVTTFLGELIGAPSDHGAPELAAARADGIVMGDQMRRAWQDFLEAETSVHPVLLVLEDLHWGDLPSVRLIDMALRNLRDRPWMVLAFGRPEVTDVFPQLWSERGLQHIKLDELTPQACQKIIRAVLPSASPDTVTSIIEHAAGNPFYLEELVRARAENKGDALPSTVLAMVQSRLEGMHLELRRVLRAASIFGNVFWTDAIRALLGGEAFDDEWLIELERREVIERAGEGRFTSEYRFRHAVVREAAYAMLTESDRQLGHRLAAGWLEQAGETDAVALARHWELASENVRAVPWYFRAAAQAHDGNDFLAAIERAKRGIAIDPDGEMVGAFYYLMAESHRWRAEHQEAAECAERARALAVRGSVEWLRAQGVFVLAASNIGVPEIAIAAIDDLLSIESTSDVDTWVMVYTRTAGCASGLGQFERARKCAAAAERAFARGGGSLLADGWGSHAKTVDAAIDGDYATVAFAHERAASLLERAGDIRHSMLELTNAGDARKEIGDYATAEAHLRKGLAAGERMGLTLVVAMCKANLSFALGRQGKLEAGLKLATSAAEEAVRIDNPRMEGYTRTYLSSLRLRAGDLAGAEEQARIALGLLESAHSAALPQAQAVLAKIELVLGRNESAKLHAGAAIRALERDRAVEEGEAMIRLTWGEALDANGDRAGARAVIDVARDRLLLRASKISDLSLRKCFLEGVEENARTLALADAWSR